MKQTIVLILKGMVIGIANVIPGVSGGTMAVILRIYERFLGAIASFFKDWKKNLGFLACVLGGVAIGILAFSWVVSWALTEHRSQAMFLFIGLIAGSLPALVGEARSSLGSKGWRWYYLIPFALTLGLMILIFFTERPEANTPITSRDLPSLGFLFLSGIVGAGTMILPGISGSFTLLLMGSYTTVINAVKELPASLMAVGSNPEAMPRLLDSLLVLGVTGVGIVIGLVGVSAIVKKLLERFFVPTYMGILGLVAGSVLLLWPGFSLDLGGLVSLLCCAVGFSLAFMTGRIKKPAAPAS